MKEVVIVGGIRTAIGSHGGAFRTITAQELAETQSRAARQLRQRAVYLTAAFAVAMILAGALVAGLGIVAGHEVVHSASCWRAWGSAR